MIHQESKVVIKIINDVPSEFYCGEVKTNFPWIFKSNELLVIFLRSWSFCRNTLNQRRSRRRVSKYSTSPSPDYWRLVFLFVPRNDVIDWITNWTNFLLIIHGCIEGTCWTKIKFRNYSIKITFTDDWNNDWICDGHGELQPKQR